MMMNEVKPRNSRRRIQLQRLKQLQKQIFKLIRSLSEKVKVVSDRGEEVVEVCSMLLVWAQLEGLALRFLVLVAFEDGRASYDDYLLRFGV